MFSVSMYSISERVPVHQERAVAGMFCGPRPNAVKLSRFLSIGGITSAFIRRPPLILSQLGGAVIAHRLHGHTKTVLTVLHETRSA